MPTDISQKLRHLARDLKPSWYAQAAWLEREAAEIERTLGCGAAPDWQRDLIQLEGWGSGLEAAPWRSEAELKGWVAELWRLSSALDAQGIASSALRLKLLALYLQQYLGAGLRHRQSKAASVRPSDFAVAGFPFEAAAVQMAGYVDWNAGALAKRFSEILKPSLSASREAIEPAVLYWDDPLDLSYAPDAFSLGVPATGSVELAGSDTEGWVRLREAEGTVNVLARAWQPERIKKWKTGGGFYNHYLSSDSYDRLDPNPLGSDQDRGPVDKRADPVGNERGGKGPPADRGEPLGQEDQQPEPKEKRFLFRLEGDQARGRSVVSGAGFDLRFDFAAPRMDDGFRLTGRELVAAQQQSLAFDLLLHAEGFDFDDGVAARRVEFENGELKRRVVFCLRAPEQPVGERARVWACFSRQGRPFYEAPLDIRLVEDTDALAKDPQSPLEINLDALAKGPQGDSADDSEAAKPQRVILYLSGDDQNLHLTYDDGESAVPARLGFGRTALATTLGSLQADLKTVLDDSLWSALDDAGFGGDKAETRAKTAPALARLATAGSKLWCFLCEDKHFKKCLDRLDLWDEGAEITIRTKGVFLPWEILYPGHFDFRLGQSPDAARFWGHRFHIVSRSTRWREAGELAPRSAAPPTNLRLHFNPEIDDGALDDSAPVASHRKTLDALKDRFEVTESYDFLEILKHLAGNDGDAHLIYVFTHGQCDQPFEAKATERLVFGKTAEKQIEPHTLSHGGCFDQGPIVVLNSCESGAFSPLRSENFLSIFEQRGACGLIATSFAIPSHFAAAFGRRLLAAYCEGRETIGEIVFRLRRELCERDHPLGLLYTMQCPLDAKAPGSVPSSIAESERSKSEPEVETETKSKERAA